MHGRTTKAIIAIFITAIFLAGLGNVLNESVGKVRASGGNGPSGYQITWQVELPKVSDFIRYVADSGDTDTDGKDEIAIVPYDRNYGGAGDVDTLTLFDDNGSILWTQNLLKEHCTISVWDYDLDGRDEVFVGGTDKDDYNADGHIWAFEENGSLSWEFVDTDEYGFWAIIPGHFTFKNIDADPELEIIVSNCGYPNKNNYALDTNGSLIWRYDRNEASNVLMGDFDDDGEDEILLMTSVGKMVYAIEPVNGSEIWSIQLVNYNRGAVGDLTGDGIDDLVVLSQGHELYNPDKIYAIRNNGSILWEKDINDNYCHHPILRDVDSDGKKDILLSEGNKIMALKSDGTELWNNTLSFNLGDLYGYDIDGNNVYETVFFANKSMYKVSENGTISKVLQLDVHDDWRPMTSRQGRTSVEKSRYGAYITTADTNGNGIDEFLIEEVFSDHVKISAVEPILQTPSIVYVDDNFNSSTPGWQYNHFNVIQDGINAVAENGTVYVFNGTYYENVIVNKTVILIGEDRNGTIIDGNYTGDAVYISGNWVNISGFTVRNSGSGYNYAGIAICSVNHATVKNNAFTINWIGIYIVSSENNVVANNIIRLNNWDGIRFDYCYNNTIISNSIESNSGYAIDLYRSNYNIITTNYITSNQRGIEISSSANNSITNNMISSNTEGLRLESYCSSNIVDSNIFTNNGNGVVLFYSSNNTINKNNISSNDDYGLLISYSYGNTIIFNNILNNGWGIALWHSINNIIGNNAVKLHINPIWLYYSSNNTILSNNISNNWYGIYLNSSNSNIIYNNYFDNTNNAYDNGNNTWNISKILGTNIIGGAYIAGNYWSDYNGIDTNGDGLGDMNLPYNCNRNIQNGGDYHPLVFSSAAPSIVYVDDDFTSSTPGWQYDHFDVIQDGINAVAENGTVYVYNGTYYENVVVNKRINLIGEDRNGTIIDGGGVGDTVHVYASWVFISNLTMQNCGKSNAQYDASLDLGGNSYCQIENCNFFLPGLGIFIQGNYNVFRNCNVSAGSRMMFGSNYNTMYNCVFPGPGRATRFGPYAVGNSLINCTFMTHICWCGAGTASYHRIINCTFKNIDFSEGAIQISGGGEKNTIQNCVFVNCSYGIFTSTWAKFRNSIICNNVFINCSYGIYIQSSSSSNNQIYHNNFINNACNAYDISFNIWYNDTLQEGNYWSDFDEPSEGAYDSNSDGIVDIPYNIPGGSNQDLYPLMHPYGSITNLDTGEVFLTIQDAIDDSDTLAGHTIFVRNGTYYEHITVIKAINLIGEDRNGTIIDGGGSGDVIYVTADGVNVSGFIVQNSGTDWLNAGIILNGVQYCLIENTIVINNGYGGGIHLNFSTNCTITRTTVKDCDCGIDMYYASNNVISSCNFYSNIVGIHFPYSPNTQILDCTLIDDGTGINTSLYANNSKIINCNIINSSSYGFNIFLAYASNVEIANCTISGGGIGIAVWPCEHCIVRNCTITQNDVGIYVPPSGGGIGGGEYDYNNSFYNNYLDNLVNSIDNEYNTWNISKTLGTNIIGGSYLGGNYWSDYAGVDTDGDGLGDTNLPYNCSGNIQNGGDYLPLVFSSAAPSIVYVDDDYNSSILGWQYDHFNVIQDGIDAVAENGTVYVFNGTYYENVVVNKTVNLVGEGRDGTIIQSKIPNNHVLEIIANYTKVGSLTVNGSTNGYGIYLNNVSNCNICNTKSTNSYRGIDLHYSSRNNIKSNICFNDAHGGISLWYSSHNYIVDNIGMDNAMAIELKESNYNYVFGNTCYSIGYGIQVWGSSFNYISNNIVSRNESGEYTDRGINFDAFSMYNTVQDNDIWGNKYGVFFWQNCDNNIISNNNIWNNSYGIYFETWGGSSTNNSFYHNNFVNNFVQAYDSYHNFYDSGYPSGGNYWDDYAGVDTDGDGLGDTNLPYNSSGNIQNGGDWHPLVTPNYAPTAYFSYSPLNPTDLVTIAFTDSSSDSDGSIVNWTWNFGDGNVSYEQNPSHKYADDGTYLVNLTVTDDDGATDTFQKSIAVSNVPPNADFSWSPSNPTTADTISFTDSSSDSDGSIVSWSWKFGDGTTSTLQNPSHKYADDGTYLVNLTVTDDDGATDTFQKSIAVSNVAPTADFSYAPLNPSTADTIQFTDSSSDSDGSVVSWSWEFGDGTTSTLQNPSHKYADDGTYNVTLVVTDNDGANDSTFKLIAVSNVPPTADFSYSPHSPNNASVVNFKDLSADSDGFIMNWTWNFGDGNVSYIQHPHHRYVSPGIYTVTLTVIDDNGASDSISRQINVSIAPKPYHPTLPETLIILDGLHEWNETHWGITPETLICFDMEVAEKAGLYNIHYKVDDGNWTEYEGCFTLPLGLHSIYYYGIGEFGMRTEVARIVVNVVSSLSPETLCILSPHKPDGENGWYKGSVTITLSATDNLSGVNRTYYKLNNGEWEIYGNKIKISADGEYTLHYYSVDNEGNAENEKTISFRIDMTAPSIEFKKPSYGYLYIMGRQILPLKHTLIIGKAMMAVDASDEISDIEKVEFYVDDELKETLTAEPYSWTWDETAFFTHTIKVIAYDNAGNTATDEQAVWIFNL